MEIMGYKLKKTCPMNPEQYNVFKEEKQVGYLRLRYGYFTVESPDCCDRLLYKVSPKGYGSFDDDERGIYLDKAIEAIDKYLNF